MLFELTVEVDLERVPRLWSWERRREGGAGGSQDGQYRENLHDSSGCLCCGTSRLESDDEYPEDWSIAKSVVDYVFKTQLVFKWEKFEEGRVRARGFICEFECARGSEREGQRLCAVEIHGGLLAPRTATKVLQPSLVPTVILEPLTGDR